MRTARNRREQDFTDTRTYSNLYETIQVIRTRNNRNKRVLSWQFSDGNLFYKRIVSQKDKSLFDHLYLYEYAARRRGMISKAKSFGEPCRHAWISRWSEPRALSPVREYLAAISWLSEGHRLGARIDISAYISSDKGERKDDGERSGTEVYEEKLPGKEENAVLAWRESGVYRSQGRSG